MKMPSLIPVGRERSAFAQPFVSLQREIDRLFEDFTRGFPSLAGGAGGKFFGFSDASETREPFSMHSERSEEGIVMFLLKLFLLRLFLLTCSGTCSGTCLPPCSGREWDVSGTCSKCNLASTFRAGNEHVNRGVAKSHCRWPPMSHDSGPRVPISSEPASLSCS